MCGVGQPRGGRPSGRHRRRKGRFTGGRAAVSVVAHHGFRPGRRYRFGFFHGRAKKRTSGLPQRRQDAENIKHDSRSKPGSLIWPFDVWPLMRRVSPIAAQPRGTGDRGDKGIARLSPPSPRLRRTGCQGPFRRERGQTECHHPGVTVITPPTPGDPAGPTPETVHRPSTRRARSRRP